MNRLIIVHFSTLVGILDSVSLGSTPQYHTVVSWTYVLISSEIWKTEGHKNNKKSGYFTNVNSALKFRILGMCDSLVLNCGSVNFILPWPTQIYPDLEIKEQQKQETLTYML